MLPHVTLVAGRRAKRRRRRSGGGDNKALFSDSGACALLSHLRLRDGSGVRLGSDPTNLSSYGWAGHRTRSDQAILPGLRSEVEEGCRPCMLRLPAPWDAHRPSVRRRRPWVHRARCFCTSSKSCGVDAARTVGHSAEPHPGSGVLFNWPPFDCLIKTTLLKKKPLHHRAKYLEIWAPLMNFLRKVH